MEKQPPPGYYATPPPAEQRQQYQAYHPPPTELPAQAHPAQQTTAGAETQSWPEQPPTGPPESAEKPPPQHPQLAHQQHYPPPPPVGHEGLYQPPIDQSAQGYQPQAPPEHATLAQTMAGHAPQPPGATWTVPGSAYPAGEASSNPQAPSSALAPGAVAGTPPAAAGALPPDEEEEDPPPLPPRHGPEAFAAAAAADDDDPSDPIHYTRDPHKLIAYLVPFPKPQLKGADASKIPDRFLIYTPPPPPLVRPKEGEKEGRRHRVQRKWQEEVREAKASQAKTTSWKGIKSRATRAVDWGMGRTTSSNIDFLNRIAGSGSESPPRPKSQSRHDSGGALHSDKDDKDDDDDDAHEADTTKKTVGATHLVLVYPPSMPGSPAQLRAEFVNSMLRSRSKAQRDAIIATGLLPVTLAIDVLATVVWPFGGLVEIDAVWLFASLRGAKVARSTTKRLTSAEAEAEAEAKAEASSIPAGTAPPPDGAKPHARSDKNKDATLHLTFTPSARLDVLRAYLAARCRERDAKLFPAGDTANASASADAGAPAPAPDEAQVLEAIGWAPSQSGGTTRNWEDERWERDDVTEDLRATFAKAAREWARWCRGFGRGPERALRR